MEKRKYKRLHYEDRQTIEAMSKQNNSVKDIAEALGTHRDTIYRVQTLRGYAGNVHSGSRGSRHYKKRENNEIRGRIKTKSIR